MTSALDRIRRHSERAGTERAQLDAVLDAGDHVASLSTVVDGSPWVVPMLYARVGDRIVLHGSTGAGALRQVAAGAEAAVCVTHLDGWVYAHTLFDSSANYRSAVVRGTLIPLTGQEAAEALAALSERVFPGRGEEVPAFTRRQLAATQALAMDIVDGRWTVKVRDAGPGEPESDEEVDPALWRGVLPIRTVYGTPETAEDLSADHPVSPSVQRLVESGAR